MRYEFYEEARQRGLPYAYHVSSVNEYITDAITDIIFISGKNLRVEHIKGLHRGSTLIFISYNQASVREDMQAVANNLVAQHRVELRNDRITIVKEKDE